MFSKFCTSMIHNPQKHAPIFVSMLQRRARIETVMVLQPFLGSHFMPYLRSVLVVFRYTGPISVAELMWVFDQTHTSINAPTAPSIPTHDENKPVVPYFDVAMCSHDACASIVDTSCLLACSMMGKRIHVKMVMQHSGPMQCTFQSNCHVAQYLPFTWMGDGECIV